MEQVFANIAKAGIIVSSVMEAGYAYTKSKDITAWTAMERGCANIKNEKWAVFNVKV
jgi:hypothetical protein